MEKKDKKSRGRETGSEGKAEIKIRTVGLGVIGKRKYRRRFVSEDWKRKGRGFEKAGMGVRWRLKRLVF